MPAHAHAPLSCIHHAPFPTHTSVVATLHSTYLPAPLCLLPGGQSDRYFTVRAARCLHTPLTSRLPPHTAHHYRWNGKRHARLSRAPRTLLARTLTHPRATPCLLAHTYTHRAACAALHYCLLAHRARIRYATTATLFLTGTRAPPIWRGHLPVEPGLGGTSQEVPPRGKLQRMRIVATGVACYCLPPSDAVRCPLLCRCRRGEEGINGNKNSFSRCHPFAISSTT